MPQAISTESLGASCAVAALPTSFKAALHHAECRLLANQSLIKAWLLIAIATYADHPNDLAGALPQCGQHSHLSPDLCQCKAVVLSGRFLASYMLLL